MMHLNASPVTLKDVSSLKSNVRAFKPRSKAVLRCARADAADAEHRARVAVAMNRKATPLEKIEEKVRAHFLANRHSKAVCNHCSRPASPEQLCAFLRTP